MCVYIVRTGWCRRKSSQPREHIFGCTLMPRHQNDLAIGQSHVARYDHPRRGMARRCGQLEPRADAVCNMVVVGARGAAIHDTCRPHGNHVWLLMWQLEILRAPHLWPPNTCLQWNAAPLTTSPWPCQKRRVHICHSYLEKLTFGHPAQRMPPPLPRLGLFPCNKRPRYQREPQDQAP